MEKTRQSLMQDLAVLQQTVQAMQSKLDQQALVIETLREQLRALKRRQFGRSSEKLDKQVEQLETRLEELEIDEGANASLQAVIADAPSPMSAPTPTTSRVRYPEDLPKKAIKIAPPSHCPKCDGSAESFTHIGDDVSMVLDVIPARYRLLEITRPKFSCGCCQTVVQGDAPNRVIPKGSASAALLTQVVLDKYCDHLPLYRQSERMDREGIHLPRSTLADWTGQVSQLLTPLALAIERHVKQASHLYADDTTAPTLSPGKGRTQIGRYWTYVRDGRDWQEDAAPAVWLQYSEDRKAIHPNVHLKGYQGAMQADAYAGYNDVYQRKVTFVACMAHVRRKFFEISQSDPSPLADIALQTIQSLYVIEESIKGKPPDERRRVRQQQAKPIMEEFKCWLDATLKTLSKKSALSKAIQYARNQWEGLMAYLEDGRYAIDNNSAERSLRPIAIGRKNYLFAGSVSGGKRAAILYSIISTAKLNGINPKDYLTCVLRRIGQHPINQIEDLLPWNIDLEKRLENDAL